MGRSLLGGMAVRLRRGLVLRLRWEEPLLRDAERAHVLLSRNYISGVRAIDEQDYSFPSASAL